MFFGLSFQFRVILEEFDAQDGLRKLYNVVSFAQLLQTFFFFTTYIVLEER